MSYQLFDTLSAEEYEALKTDIAQQGVLVPIEYDQEGNILDGHHRIRACRELGITTYPTVIRHFHTDEERETHIVTLNVRRRHLTTAQKQKWTAWFLKRDTHHSDRQIAAAAGVSHPTVAKIRGGLETRGDLEKFTSRLGLDGKSRPATRLCATASPASAAVPLLYTQDDAATIPKPHVAHNSGNNEWYTPPEYLTAARQVLGTIDLDPASSVLANQTVQAARFFTADDDGLAHPWTGTTWMNPPYAAELIGPFITKLCRHVTAGDIPAAIVLVNNATETTWFHDVARHAGAICFPRGRVRFRDPDGNPGAPLQGQAVLYIGAQVAAFQAAFTPFGVVFSR